jgi:hypothetical protein
MGVYTNDPSQDMHILGGLLYCKTPQAQPILTCFYFISFIFIVSFSILSLIIGSIGDAMMVASIEMKKKQMALKLIWHERRANIIINRLESMGEYSRKGPLKSILL